VVTADHGLLICRLTCGDSRRAGRCCRRLAVTAFVTSPPESPSHRRALIENLQQPRQSREPGTTVTTTSLPSRTRKGVRREKVSGTVYRKLTWVLRTVEAREDRNDQFRKVGFIMCSTGSMLGSRIFTKHEDCISPEVLGASYWMWGQCDWRCGQHQSAWTFFCQSALFKTRAHGYAESPFRGALQKKPRQCLGFFTP
jgi:hypothetical protein